MNELDEPEIKWEPKLRSKVLKNLKVSSTKVYAGKDIIHFGKTRLSRFISKIKFKNSTICSPRLKRKFFGGCGKECGGFTVGMTGTTLGWILNNPGIS